MTKSKFLVCDSFTILEIVDTIEMMDKKYKKKAIYEVLQGLDIVHNYKVGEDLLVEDNRIRMRKNIYEQYPKRKVGNAYEHSRYKKIKDRLEGKEPSIDINQPDWADIFDLFEHLKNVDIVKLSEVKEKLDNIAKDKDSFYRVFHHSLKMYYVKDYVVELAQLMIEMVTQKKYEITSKKNLVNKMQELEFHFVLVDGINDILNASFYNQRNIAESWYEDSVKLFGILSLFIESTNFLYLFYREVLDRKAFFNLDTGSLSSEQAGAMAVWRPLGVLRSSRDEEWMIKLKV